MDYPGIYWGKIDPEKMQVNILRNMYACRKNYWEEERKVQRAIGQKYGMKPSKKENEIGPAGTFYFFQKTETVLV